MSELYSFKEISGNAIEIKKGNEKIGIFQSDNNLTEKEENIITKLAKDDKGIESLKNAVNQENQAILNSFIKNDFGSKYRKDQIKALQYKFNLNPDGKFSKELFFAVIDFQKTNGITPNGIPDKNFFKKIDQNKFDIVEKQQKIEEEKNLIKKTKENSLSKEAVSSYLEKFYKINLSKYSPEIKQKFIEEIFILFEEFKNFDESQIGELRKIREIMSFGMEQGKTDEYYRNMIIGNVIEKRIKLLQIYIEDITGEKIKIGNAEINKANYDEFKNKTIQIDKTNGINMFGELDKLLKNSTINFLYSKQQFKQLFSKELIKIIDNKDPQSQTIKSSLQRTPYLTGDKGFENKTVKLINGKTINIKEIYEQYDYLYEDFTKKNDLFIFGNKQNKGSKKGFGLNDAKFKRGYKEIENVYQEKLQNIENFSVTELVIMLRVLFSVLPIAGDTLGGYDDLNQALAKINFDGSMQGLGENVFMYAISGLQLTFVGGWFAKLTKGPKLTKAMINITKIINKLSNNPKMLNDISKNNKVMQILENMRGKMPGIESFLEKIKSTKINKSLQKSKPTQNYTPKFLPKNPERKNLEIILSNIIKSPEGIKILENILNINLPKLGIKKYLSEINIAQKISLGVMSTGLISLFLCIYGEDCVEDIEKIGFKIFGYTGFEFSEKIKQIKQLPQEQRDVILKGITKEISKQIIMAYAFEKFKKEFNANPKLNFMDYCIKNGYIKKYEELGEFAFETLNSEIYNSLDKYRERYFYIREYYNKFNGNPHEMIKDLYGVQTKGDIKVELEGASIIFAFNKPEDYQKIEGSNSKSQSGGFNNPNKLMGGFIAINKSVCGPTTKIHELQHSEDYLIFDYNGPISSLKTEIIARIKDGMNKKYSISQLTNEKGFYNYYKGLKESSPTEYKEKWSNHIKLAEYYIEIAFLVKIKYPDNANFILSFTNIEDWEKLIIDKII